MFFPANLLLLMFPMEPTINLSKLRECLSNFCAVWYNFSRDHCTTIYFIMSFITLSSLLEYHLLLALLASRQHAECLCYIQDMW